MRKIALVVILMLTTLSLYRLQTVQADTDLNLVINEVMSGIDKSVEIFNPTINPINLSDYNLTIYHQGVSFAVSYNFPLGASIASGDYVVVHLRTGVNAENEYYISSDPPIMWNNGGAVELYDMSNTPLDFVRFNGSTKDVPIGTGWTGITPTITNTENSLGRDLLGQDTDDGNDWIEQIPSLGSLNTAQSCYFLTISLIGNGTMPTATVDRSAGCNAGYYHAEESISLIGASPSNDWEINGWNGTTNDASTDDFNTVIMPNSVHTVEVIYTEIPLDQPNLVSPVDEVSTYNRTPLFDWYDVEDATEYIHQYSQDAAFLTSFETFVATSESRPSEYIQFGDWYWRVKAIGDRPDSEWSEVWSFTIEQLESPELLSPVNLSNTYDHTPALYWEDVVGGTDYVLQYDDNEFFTGAVEENVIESSFTISNDLGNATYFWRVKATDGCGNESFWSDVWSFTIMEDPYWIREFGYGAGWEDPYTPRKVADVNGDGISDLVGFSVSGVRVAVGTGTDFSPSTLWTFNYGNWDGTKHIRTLADVNGDGMADIVGFGDVGVIVSLSDGTKFGPSSYWTYGYSFLRGWDINNHPRMLADVNGDGMDDVIGFGDVGVMVSLSDGTKFGPVRYWAYGYSYLRSWDGIQHPRLFADVNGDGLDDLIGFGEVGVLVSLSDGNQFNPTGYWIYGYSYLRGWDGTRHVRTIGDVNGDGLVDLVGFGDIGVLVALSDGTQFIPEDHWAYGYNHNRGWDVNHHPRMIKDVNGDNLDDVVGFGTNGVLVELSNCITFE